MKALPLISGFDMQKSMAVFIFNHFKKIFNNESAFFYLYGLDAKGDGKF